MLTMPQFLGNLIDQLGTILGAKEYGLSERLAGNRPTTNTGSTIQSRQAGYTPYTSANSSNKSSFYQYQSTPAQNSAGQVQGLSTTYNPSTGGQGAGAGGGGGGTAQLTPPDTSYQGPSEQDVINQLRGVYGQSAADINNEGANLDKTYGLAKSDIQQGIDETTKAGEAQKEKVGTVFGDLLKQNLQTYQDLGRQRQGTFSSLGTLDSSAFGEQQARADQNYADTVSKIGLEKANQTKTISDSVDSYVKKAQGELSRLALNYQQGKNAIASALANNNLQEAGAIQNALDQIRTRAQDVRNTIIDFQNRAALLRAQGVDVATGISGINGGQFVTDTANTLNQSLASGKQMYTLPSRTVQGEGYIGEQKKKGFLENLLQGLGT